MTKTACPTSFSNPSSRAPSTVGASSLTSTTKTKRCSLNVVSPPPASGPRPLHLTLGSVVAGSSQNSPSHSPAPETPETMSSQMTSAASNSGRNTPFDVASVPSENEKENKNGNGNGNGGVKIDSPSSLWRAPLETRDARPEGRGKRPSNSTGGRRQSSISYISNSPSRTNFGKRNSVDNLGLGPGLVRSPLSSSHHTTSFFEYDGGSGGGLVRNNSLGGKSSKSPRSPAVDKRTSIGATMETKDRSPVTLAEKHSELLHFIAQKESKCLELRSQLAMHEAELLQLKRKWERIVNRGFEKALSPSNSNATSANSPTTATLPPTASVPCSPSPAIQTYTFSPGSPSSTDTFSPSLSYFPTLKPATAAAGVAPGGVDGVLEGIKEGVQGMSRLIAAGLGSITQVVPAEQAQTQSSSSAPLPLRLGGTTTRTGGGSGGSKRISRVVMTNGVSKGSGSGHGQRESQSSSSTTSSAASISLLSTSSGTSVTSALASLNGSPISGNTSKRTPEVNEGVTLSQTSSEVETESEFGDFEDGQSSHPHPYSNGQQQHDDQVLMVRDTVATPTMSSNPDFRGSKDSRAQNLDFHRPLWGGGEDKDPGFDWDDGWGEPVGERLSSGMVDANASGSGNASESPTTGVYGGPKSPLAPMSAIPAGLASITTAAAPTAQQMSSWVGSVGRRWGEIKESTTFAKNQKRASVLLSDMQQSLVSVLASPSTASGTAGPASASSPPFTNMSYYSVAPTTPSGKRSPPPSSSKTRLAFQLQPPAQKGMSTSLLDGSDDESFGESVADAGGDNTVRLVPVMVPDSKDGNIVGVVTQKEEKTKVDDEDELNW